MFDIGFWELAVLGVIALIVLGPERLPVVARTVGRWVSRAKGYMNAITSELEREVKADDIRKEVQRAREQIESETRNVHSETRKSVEPVMKPLDDSLPKPQPGSSSTGDKPAATATSPTAPNTAESKAGQQPGDQSAPTPSDKASISADAGAPQPAARPDDNKHNAS